MKKRIVSMMLAAMVALSVVGCGSKTLSNDYVTVKQYKGLEVAQVEKVEVTDEQVEAVTYAHGSKDTLKRDVASDLMAADDMMKRGITGIDVVKALA